MRKILLEQFNEATIAEFTDVLPLSIERVGEFYYIDNLFLDKIAPYDRRITCLNLFNGLNAETVSKNFLSGSASSNLTWISVAYSPTLKMFAAVADDSGTSSIMTSYDGVLWTARTTSSVAGYKKVVWCDGAAASFVAVGNSSSTPIAVSTNGTTWTLKTTTDSGGTPTAYAFTHACWNTKAQKLLILNASTGNYIYTDLTHWRTYAGLSVGETISDIAQYPIWTETNSYDSFIVVTTGSPAPTVSLFVIQMHGETTYGVFPLSGDSHGMVGGNIKIAFDYNVGNVVAVNSVGTAGYRMAYITLDFNDASPVPATWVVASSDKFPVSFSSIKYFEQLRAVVAIASDTALTHPRIYYSYDGGVTWEYAQLPSGIAYADVAFSEYQNMLACVADSGSLCRSFQGGF